MLKPNLLNMVLFYLVHKHVARRATCLWEKDTFFRPAGGASGRSSR
jgi:hypothetical protein